MIKNVSFAPLIAVVISLGFALVNFIWILIDQQPHPIADEYILKTIELSRGYTEHAWYEIIRDWYWASIGPRPPLYQIFASFFVHIFGESVDNILVVNCLALTIMGVTTYFIALRVSSPVFAVLAVLLLLSFNLTTELSRLAKPHGIAAAFTALAFLFCFKIVESNKPTHAWILALVMGLAFASHPSSLYVLIAPVLASIVQISYKSLTKTHRYNFLKVMSDPIFKLGLIPALLTLTSIISMWMYVKWGQYLALEEVISKYFIPNQRRFNLERNVHLHINPLNAVMLVIGLVAISVSDFRNRSISNAGLLVIWGVGIMLTFHILHPGTLWQNFGGALPLISIIIVAALMKVSQQLSRVLLAFVLIFFGAYATQSYLSFGWGTHRYIGQACGELNPTCNDKLYNIRSRKPLSEAWNIKELLEPIFKHGKCTSVRICTVNLISHRSQYFSDELLKQFIVREFPKLSLLNSDSFYAQRNIYVTRMRETSRPSSGTTPSDYYVYLTDSAGKPINLLPSHYAEGVFEAEAVSYIQSRLETEYSLLKSVPLPNGENAHLVRKGD